MRHTKSLGVSGRETGDLLQGPLFQADESLARSYDEN